MTSGEYSAKPAYLMQFDGSIQSSYPAKVWQVWAPSRYKFFIWLLLQQQQIWTADCLLLREWPNQYFCPLCMRNLEMANNLFAECPVSRHVWTKISNWADVPSLHPYRWAANQAVAGWFNELSGSTASSQSRGIQSMTILICWSLWCERNARVFEGVEKNCSRIVADIKEEVRMWCHAGAKHLSVIVSSLVRE
jgi:hypothetical protein